MLDYERSHGKFYKAYVALSKRLDPATFPKTGEVDAIAGEKETEVPGE